MLITHGGIDPEDGFQHAVLIEVVPDGAAGGDIVWRLDLGTEDDPYTVYRAERVASLVLRAGLDAARRLSGTAQRSRYRL